MTDEVAAAPEETPEAAPLTPTSAGEWPSAEKGAGGNAVELPSGAVARLRYPPLQYLLATGRVPPKLWSRLHKDGTAVLVDPLRTLEAEEIKLFVDWMIAESFVEPRVSMTRKAGGLYIGDLSEDDKSFVMATIGLSLTG